MTRVFLIPILLLLAWPAVAEDDLETKLKEIEARVARLRAAAQREKQARSEIDKQIAALDVRIAEAQKLDATALGATRIAELRAERAELEASRRTGSRALRRGSQETAAKLTALEKKRQPVDLVGLIAKSRTGDPTARAELSKLRAQIDQAIRSQPVQASSQLIGLGGFRARGRVQIINRAVARGVMVIPSQGGTQPAQPEAPKKEIPAAEQEKRAEQDRSDQEKRAEELEKRIVDMTRKLLDLEQRLSDLKQKVAKADRG